jgi:hypothetical protein
LCFLDLLLVDNALLILAVISVLGKLRHIILKYWWRVVRRKIRRIPSSTWEISWVGTPSLGNNLNLRAIYININIVFPGRDVNPSWQWIWDNFEFFKRKQGLTSKLFSVDATLIFFMSDFWKAKILAISFFKGSSIGRSQT